MIDFTKLQETLPSYTYIVLDSDTIQRQEDGAFIPVDLANTDYQMYLKITGQPK